LILTISTKLSGSLAIKAFSRVVEAVSKANLHLYRYGDKRPTLIDVSERFKLTNHLHLHILQHDTASLWQSTGLSVSTSPSYPLWKVSSMASQLLVLIAITILLP
jgi:hypothetical protein